MKNFNKKKAAAILVTVAVLASVFAVPSGRNALFRILHLLGSADLGAVTEYIRSFGIFAAVISILLMVLQSVAAPIPAFVITFANAAVFGWIGGAALSWAGAMCGAALCFGIARLFGRGLVVRLTGDSALRSVDSFLEKHGAKSIFIARLLPFVPFDPISYAAGLTGIRFVPFLVATGLGQLPATIAYSYAGGMLTGGTRAFMYGIAIILTLGTLSMLLRSAYKRRRQKKAAKAPQPSDMNIERKENPHV